MIDAELKKTIKNDPVVEYEIPKRIFTVAPVQPQGEESRNSIRDIVQTTDGNALTELWAF